MAPCLCGPSCCGYGWVTSLDREWRHPRKGASHEPSKCKPPPPRGSGGVGSGCGGSGVGDVGDGRDTVKRKVGIGLALLIAFGCGISPTNTPNPLPGWTITSWKDGTITVEHAGLTYTATCIWVYSRYDGQFHVEHPPESIAWRPYPWLGLRLPIT